jgi:hypothetical protein
MKTIKDFLSVVDYQTLIVSVLALGSTFACEHFGLVANIPTSLIGLAVVFPIVFSINAAYKRREEALKYFSGIKAHAVALYYAHRDWVPGSGGKESAHAGRVRSLIENLLGCINDDLSEGGRRQESFEKVIGEFSKFSGSIEKLREAKVATSEISRANQYVSKMMIDFERMRNIATYRTPVTLRAYSRVFLNLFPIAFGPYFAHLNCEAFPLVGYFVAVLYSLVLVTLDNLQEDLEDPFDKLGPDDIRLNVVAAYRPVVSE